MIYKHQQIIPILRPSHFKILLICTRIDQQSPERESEVLQNSEDAEQVTRVISLYKGH